MKLWLFVIVVLSVPTLAFFVLQSYEKQFAALPVYGPVSEENGVAQYHQTEDFILINQDGRKTGSVNAEGKISVVNFFFTSCPTICPRMMRGMQRVQELYLNDPDILFMSLTVDPKRDTPERLKVYAQAYNAHPQQWQFLTGDKKEIYRLARKSYFLIATDGDGGKHDFIHSENLVLVDQKGRIRGYYDGTDENAVDQLVRDIAKLKKRTS